jgi:hypothetical protein
MLKKYRIEKPLDDYVILNNLDAFKAQIAAQAQYCDDVQDEMRILTERLKKREKKYQRLKSDHKNLVEKSQRVDNENASLKSQLEVYKLLLNNNLIIGNNRTFVSTQQGQPPPPPPPPPYPVAKGSDVISLGTQNRLPKKMDSVLDELKRKIKPFESNTSTQ